MKGLAALVRVGVSGSSSKPIPEIAAILNELSDFQLAAVETRLTVEFALTLAEAAVTDSVVVYDLFAVRPKPGQIAALVGLRDLLRSVRYEVVARERWAGVTGYHVTLGQPEYRSREGSLYAGEDVLRVMKVSE